MRQFFVLFGIFVLLAMVVGCDRVSNPVQQIYSEDAPPLQEEIESSVSTSAPQDVPPMSFTGIKLYYADNHLSGYTFGVYCYTGISSGSTIRIGVGGTPTVAVVAMPETPEGKSSKVLWFDISEDLVEDRVYDQIEIRVEVVSPTGYYLGSDSLWFNPDTDQPSTRPDQEQG